MVGFFFAIVSFACLGVSIWAIVDAASRSSGAFSAAGSNKALWITLVAVFTLLTGFIGFILACVYLGSVRQRVRAVGG